MFKVLDGRKRRVISARTVFASAAAHVLLLGGAVYAAAADTAPREVIGMEVDLLPPVPVEPAPPVETVEPPPPPAEPSTPDAPAPVFGARLELPAPVEAPAGIIDEPPGVQPVDVRDYGGDRPAGDMIGTPPVVPAPPSGNMGNAVEPFIPDESMVEVRPELNRGGLARTMERYYPPVLRDSRVTGTVLIEVVVGEDGRVRPNTARVMEASHPAFGEAAVRAAERFRFSPAKIGNVAVPVRVVIPINWTLPD